MRRRKFLSVGLGGLASLGAMNVAGRNSQPPFPEKATPKDTRLLAKVLGTAQDGGLPQIGCYCENCLRARRDPGFSRLISSIGLIDLEEKKSFLVDATPDVRIQSAVLHERLGLEEKGRKNKPDAILLTHAHIGHYTGLMFYGYEAMSAEKLPVYCSERMEKFLSSNGPWDQLVRQGNILIRALAPDKEFRLTEHLSVTAFSVPHRGEYSDTLGFIFCGEKRDLLYIPDIQNWEAWDRPIQDEVARVDIALLDGTFFRAEELPGRDLSKIGHPLIVQSVAVLDEAVRKQGRQVYFTHLNHANLALPPESEARKMLEAEGFGIAADGMEFFL
jgi:pyrroloquinoline quinone biosynthesis protein B